MTLADISNRITFFTGQGTNGYPNADRLIAINKANNDIQTMILQSMDGWDFDDKNKSDFPILTANLVANRQDYGFQSDFLKIKRLDVSYDGSTWHNATPFDVSETTNPLDSTSVLKNFSVDRPFYDVVANALMLYPVPTQDVASGLKIWVDREMTQFTLSDLTTGTVSPGFDRQFHEMIPLSASYDWAIKTGADNANFLKNQLIEYEQRLKQYYGSKQKDRNYVLKSAFVDYN